MQTGEHHQKRWSFLKKNVLHLWDKFSDLYVDKSRQRVSKMLNRFGRKPDRQVTPEDIHIENYHYESHRIDDLPLTMTKDPSPGVKYSYTENSEFARGAEKAQAVGIDSFGEEDTFDPDEADEHQDYRNRNQNSDLSRRYFTRGLDVDQDDYH
jgi:hypothetical protein